VAVVLPAVVSGLVSMAVVGGVATLSSGSSRERPPASAAGGGVATAAVVRTTLTNTVQVGGSITYGGSYTITAPSGSSAQDLAQAEQAVAEDRQAVSGDAQTEAGASAADAQAIGSDRTNVNVASAKLASDRAKKAHACAGRKARSPACGQDVQAVGQDQAQLTQAEQQLSAAESTATLDRDQNEAKVGSDQAKLQGDQRSLALLQAAGANPGTTYTWLPNAGQIITQDQRVYSVSNEPVPLLYGSIAAYRAFYVGMSDGADVGELTRDLIALGYGAGLTQGDHYSSATASAVERWQRALGLPATGEVLLGQVVFEPGPIRVTSVTASVGSSVGGGSGGGAVGSAGGAGGAVLTATGTTPVVTVALDVTQEYLVKPGDAVSIVLADGSSTVGGHVETVGTVATCPGAGGVGTGGGSAGQSPCSFGTNSAGAGNSNSVPTVTVTIGLDRSLPTARLDQAPVNVTVTTQRVNDVLAVPVNALLALQGGGFGVDVVSATGTHLVGVATGLYSNTLVQISGSGIAAGTRVEVPSS
jgi:Putative peptidoglycan binding domain